MIESIQLRDFRGVQHGRIEGFRQINFLVGPNNSGKSALMEALYLTGTAGRPAGLIIQNKSGSSTYDVKVSTSDLSDSQPLLRLSERHNSARGQTDLGRWGQGVLRFNLRDANIPFSAFDLTTSDSGFAQGEEQKTALFALDPLPKDNEATVQDKQPDSHALLAQELMGSEVDPFEAARLVFLWRSELTYYYKGSAAWLARGQISSPDNTFLFDAATVQNHIPLAFYERMLGTVPGWTQQIGRHFSRIFDLRTPLVVQFLPTGADRKQMQGWIAPENKPAISIDAFGDGARAAFKLLTYLVPLAANATPQSPGLLLWEEPELHQHPQTLALLIQEMVHIIQDKPIQVFIASHNLELLAHLSAMLQNGRLAPRNVLVFRLDLQAGQMKSSWFDAEILQVWLKEGFDPRVWGDFMSPLRFSLQEEVV
jgi:hypothetical protein